GGRGLAVGAGGGAVRVGRPGGVGVRAVAEIDATPGGRRPAGRCAIVRAARVRGGGPARALGEARAGAGGEEVVRQGAPDLPRDRARPFGRVFVPTRICGVWTQTISQGAFSRGA